MLILDEADLLLSYGYEDDLRLLAPQVGTAVWRRGPLWPPRSCERGRPAGRAPRARAAAAGLATRPCRSSCHAIRIRIAREQVPRSCQCMLMSATTSEDIEQLTKLVLHNPTTLNLLATPGGGDAGAGGKGGEAGGAGGLAGGGSGAAAEISHFYYPCTKDDRPLVVLALLKLGLLRKKVRPRAVQCHTLAQRHKLAHRATHWHTLAPQGLPARGPPRPASPHPHIRTLPPPPARC